MVWKKENLYATVVLTLSILISIYSLITKGKDVPSVSIVVDGITGRVIKQPGSFNERFWNNSPILTMQVEGKELRSSIDIFNQKNEKISLAKFYDGKSALIFKGTLFSRKDLIDGTLKALIQYADKNIVIAVEADNMREFLIEKFDNKIKDKVFFIERKGLGLLLEKANEPFFIVVDKAGKLSDAFYPKSEVPEMTHKYLDFILNQPNFVRTSK